MISLIVLAILIFVNAFFASAEIAFISLNDAKIDRQAKEGNKKAKRIKKMLKEARQEEYISGYCGTCTDVDIDFLLGKMQELQGSDSNE